MKTIALGVDGMEPSLCEKWIDSGELPNIENLRQNGAFGTAHCQTLISARQWTTHFTGVRANQHGIDGFLKRSDKPAFDANPGTRVSPDSKKLISTTDIKVQTYPELLDKDGVSVGLINPLPLWPPLELKNGFCISGMITPPSADTYTYPNSLAEELSEIDYQIDVQYNNRPYGFIDDPLFANNEIGIQKLKEDMFNVLEHRIDYTKRCLINREIEFLYTLLKSIDIIQHSFWAHMEHNDSEYGDTILEAYKKVDSLIGWISDNYTSVNLLVFSDHGFGARRSPRSSLLQSIVYGIDNKVTVPYQVKEFYRTVFKRDASADLRNLDQITGDHDNPAVWMLGGPDVHSCDDLAVDFEDLTPTLLALHDQPIPEAYVGNVLTEALTVEPSYVDIDLDINRTRRKEVDADVSERLYNLGYAEMVEKSHRER